LAEQTLLKEETHQKDDGQISCGHDSLPNDDAVEVIEFHCGLNYQARKCDNLFKIHYTAGALQYHFTQSSHRIMCWCI